MWKHEIKKKKLKIALATDNGKHILWFIEAKT